MMLRKIAFLDTEVDYLVSSRGYPVSNGYHANVPLDLPDIGAPEQYHDVVEKSKIASFSQVLRAIKARDSMYAAISGDPLFTSKCRTTLYRLLDMPLGHRMLHSGVCEALVTETSHRSASWCQCLANEFGVTHCMSILDAAPRFVDNPFVMGERRREFVWFLIRRLNKLALDPETIAITPT